MSICAFQAALPSTNPQQDEGPPRSHGKRPRSPDTSDDSHSRKKRQQHTHDAADGCETCPDTGPTSPPDDVLTSTNSKSTSAAEDPVSPKAKCASCACEDFDHLIKASCEHHYCRDCFEKLISAEVETPDGFPPCCCQIPIAFNVVADNVSSTVFHRYQSRQEEIRNATALYCGVIGCGVRINSKKIDGLRATCVACMRRTCTQCRGEMPLELKDIHICKKGQLREGLIASVKQEGRQACYKCGTMVSLNFGSHHMTYVSNNMIHHTRLTKGQLPLQSRVLLQMWYSLEELRMRRLRENCHFTSCRECHNFHGWEGGKPWGFRYDFGDLWDQLDVDSDQASSEEQSEGLEVPALEP